MSEQSLAVATRNSGARAVHDQSCGGQRHPLCSRRDTHGEVRSEGTLAETFQGVSRLRTKMLRCSVCVSSAWMCSSQNGVCKDSDRSSSVGSSRGCHRRPSSEALRRRIRQVQRFRSQHTTVGWRRGAPVPHREKADPFQDHVVSRIRLVGTSARLEGLQPDALVELRRDFEPHATPAGRYAIDLLDRHQEVTLVKNDRDTFSSTVVSELVEKLTVFHKGRAGAPRPTLQCLGLCWTLFSRGLEFQKFCGRR